MASDNGLTPKQRAARDIMLREFERIVDRLDTNREDQFELWKEYRDWEDMFRLIFPNEELPSLELDAAPLSQRMAGVA